MKIELTATAKNGKALNVVATSNDNGIFSYTIDGVKVEVKFVSELKKNAVCFPAGITNKYFGANQPGNIAIDYTTSFIALLQNKVCSQLVVQVATIKRLTLGTSYGDVLTVNGVEINGEVKDAILHGGVKKNGSYVITENGLDEESNIFFETETDDNNLIFGKGNW